MDRNRSALIVDDDPVSRALLAEMLGGLGLDVAEAPEAWSAMKQLRNAHPDLVCVDLMLPAISGFELCEQIRRDPGLRDLKLLVVSARSLPQDRARAREAGADAFIGKPLDIAQLADEVARLLERRKGGRE